MYADDSMEAAYEQAEQVADAAVASDEAAYAAHRVVRNPTSIRADRVMRFRGQIQNISLLQTDNDVVPAMGAVHMVRPEGMHDKHFMRDMHGDINEGQKLMVERSKKKLGPFRDRGGRSTIMDSSAHVMYRNRSGTMEITVRRNVTTSEIRVLFSKLSAHRMSASGSNVVLIKGGKRFRLGKLSEIDMHYLRKLIEECLAQYGSCGIEITEAQQGRGAMYDRKLHTKRFRASARNRSGPFQRRRRKDPEVSSDDEF